MLFHGPQKERSPWYPYVLLSCVCVVCKCGAEPSSPKMSPLGRPVGPPMRIRATTRRDDLWGNVAARVA